MDKTTYNQFDENRYERLMQQDLKDRRSDIPCALKEWLDDPLSKDHSFPFQAKLPRCFAQHLRIPRIVTIHSDDHVTVRLWNPNDFYEQYTDRALL